MPQPPGEPSQTASASLEQMLSSVEPLLGRCRPVSRARQQFLFDLAALLSGLRAVVMLDYAPGATPQQLLTLLQPLARQQPTAAGFVGCVLHLEGCCYLADLAQLCQRLSGWAANPAAWPLLVSFQGGQPAAVEPADELQQQLRALAAAVQQQLASQEQPGAGGSSQWGLLDLGRVSGLLAMPTLNGLLLGYPCVYWVRDLQEAAAASRVLSVARLRLCRIEGSCAAVAGGGPARTLLAFTAPEELCGERLDSAVQALLSRMQAASAATGCCWSGLQCCAEEVEGPRSISL